MSNKTQLQANNTKYASLIETLRGKAVGGGGAPVEQATPTITVNSSTGLITATATQAEGYVAAGTKSATKQLAFQAAQTITPGTTNKTIPANTYLGGVQTIKGDANLVASNIVSGKSIFGVVGTATAGGGGGGGNTDVEDGLITRAITSCINDRVANIGSYAFYSCESLTFVNFPQCTSIGSNAFYNCGNLTTASFPVCTYIGYRAFNGCLKLITASFPECSSIGSSAFYGCNGLTTISFSKCTTISSSAFYACNGLTTASFPVCTYIGSSAFCYCPKLSTLYLTGSSLCSLANSNAFSKAGITSTAGSIFVPASLVASYKAATNWTYFSNRIFAYN